MLEFLYTTSDVDTFAHFFVILVGMLKQTIKTDMVTAMKAKDDLRVQTLRGAIAAFTNELVSKGMKPTDEVTDGMAITVLKRLSKQRKDSADQFTKGSRPELAEKELAELAIIESYLPKGASREEIERVAKLKIGELPGADMASIGKLTGAIMKEFAGSADGNEIRDILQKLLA
jgi:uncharacterized protein YqeY